MTKAVLGWLVPIAAIFVLQSTSSFLARFIPIIAPAVSEEFRWDGSSIGYLTAANSLGSLAILIGGSTLLKQVGGMRTLQLSLVLGAASMAFFLHSIVGSLFAVSQTCWFTFTVIYLIDALGFSLGLAGVVFAVMLAGGVIGRIALGWLSDHLARPLHRCR